MHITVIFLNEGTFTIHIRIYRNAIVDMLVHWIAQIFFFVKLYRESVSRISLCVYQISWIEVLKGFKRYEKINVRTVGYNII